MPGRSSQQEYCTIAIILVKSKIRAKERKVTPPHDKPAYGDHHSFLSLVERALPVAGLARPFPHLIFQEVSKYRASIPWVPADSNLFLPLGFRLEGCCVDSFPALPDPVSCRPRTIGILEPVMSRIFVRRHRCVGCDCRVCGVAHGQTTPGRSKQQLGHASISSTMLSIGIVIGGVRGCPAPFSWRCTEANG